MPALFYLTARRNPFLFVPTPLGHGVSARCNPRHLIVPRLKEELRHESHELIVYRSEQNCRKNAAVNKEISTFLGSADESLIQTRYSVRFQSDTRSQKLVVSAHSFQK
ncbi:hypothetical protein TNCV_730661 [Trichonephila clavipes]|nr:hypothetical protein TNCV_730661 [Trichonephila clavipes]